MTLTQYNVIVTDLQESPFLHSEMTSNFVKKNGNLVL